MLHSELVDKFLRQCKYQKDLDEKTIKAYGIDLRQFSTGLNLTNEEITRNSIMEYISYLNCHYKPRTVKRKIASVKVFCNYLYDEGLLENNPFLGLRLKLPPSKTLPRTIPIRVIESMLREAHLRITSAATERKMVVALREAAVMEMLFATGMRVSELCGLLSRDIDLEDGLVRIHGKGRKERIVEIENAEVLNTLREYKMREKATEHVHFFLNTRGRPLSDQSVRIILQKYEKLANTPLHITPHMFRHSFATMLLDADVDLRYIQQLLGHSSISTTQIYTYVSSAKLKSILATKHPRNNITIK